MAKIEKSPILEGARRTGGGLAKLIHRRGQRSSEVVLLKPTPKVIRFVIPSHPEVLKVSPDALLGINTLRK